MVLQADDMIVNAETSITIYDFNITVDNQETKPSLYVKLLGVDIDNT